MQLAGSGERAAIIHDAATEIPPHTSEEMGYTYVGNGMHYYGAARMAALKHRRVIRDAQDIAVSQNDFAAVGAGLNRFMLQFGT